MLKRRFGWGIGIAIPVVLMSATVLMAAPAVPASASSNTIVTYTGLCFTDGGSTGDSTPITQHTCNGNTNAQYWEEIVNSNGSETFKNLRDFCLTDGGITGDSAPITQYKCDGSGNQEWATFIDNINENYVSIQNWNTGMCMTNDGSTADSTPITQYTCPPGNPTDTHQWFLVM
jgi:hypothetical protein